MKKRKLTRVASQQERGLRTCVACRQKAPRAELLRFVIDSEGQAWLDRYLKAPGRGAHLCYQRSCIERAVQRKALNSSFKQTVSIPQLDELLKILVDAQLSKISDLISLAQRKKIVISGLNNLEASRQRLYGLLFASDIAEGSFNKLSSWKMCEAVQPSSEKINEAPDEPHQSLQLTETRAPFFSNEARQWCESIPEWSAWYVSLIDQWSSVKLGHLIGRAPRAALGFTEADINHRLNSEIQRISQVLVASSS